MSASPQMQTMCFTPAGLTTVRHRDSFFSSLVSYRRDKIFVIQLPSLASRIFLFRIPYVHGPFLNELFSVVEIKILSASES